MAFKLHEIASMEKNTMFQKGFDESSLGTTTSWSSEPSSSSSGLNTPFGSELGSTETETGTEIEDEDFMAELTRQMANYMLQDDHDDDYEETTSPNKFSQKPEISAKWSGFNSTSIYYCDQRFMTTSIQHVSLLKLHKPIEVYQLKDQPAAKQFNPQQLQQKGGQHQHRRRNNGRGHGFELQQGGSGMRPVFIGGSGSRNGSCGTGVFLPRVINYQAESKKIHTDTDISQQKKSSHFQARIENNYQEMLLPEEWTY